MEVVDRAVDGNLRSPGFQRRAAEIRINLGRAAVKCSPRTIVGELPFIGGPKMLGNFAI